MTDAGCPITGSAIFKIEKSQPRRRIVVDELVAFARVFGIPMEQLTTAPEVWQVKRLAPLLEDWRQNIATGHPRAGGAGRRGPSTPHRDPGGRRGV